MKCLIISVLFVSLALVSCNTVWQEPFITDDGLQDAEGFYTCSAGDFQLKYKLIQNQQLHCRLSANGNGWIAVGFAPLQQMRDANFIIGYVADSAAQIRDDYGNTNTGHVSDVSIGGSNDVTLVSGSETGGRTILEFSLPLNSGDQYDKPLAVGTSYPVIFAAGNTDDFDSYHDRYAPGNIIIR